MREANRKRKNKERFKEKKKRRKKENVDTIECGLKSILRNDLSKANKQKLLQLLSAKSIVHTKIWNLASLQFLCRVDVNFELPNEAYFNKTIGQGAAGIKNSFKSSIYSHHGGFEIPDEFINMCGVKLY